MSRGPGKPPIPEHIVDGLLEHIAQGKPAIHYCREHGFSETAVHVWKHTNPEFLRRYLMARDIGYDVIAERARGTARGIRDGVNGESTGEWQRDRLIVETDLKLLAKWSKRYSDRVEIDHNAASLDDANTIADRMESVLARAMGLVATLPSTEELEDRW